MEPKMNLRKVGLRWLAAFFVVSVGLAVAADNTPETIQGLVIAVEFNEDDEVASVAIRVSIIEEDPENEEDIEIIEDYWIANTEKGLELHRLIGQEVEVTGTVTTNNEGVKIITVLSYKVIG